MGIVCVVAARMGSTRLPGKTLIKVDGRPLLEHLLDRLQVTERLDKIVVATSKLPEDDHIDNYCTQYGAACYRGSPNDVLDRIMCAFSAYNADVGVVVYGDCPIIDPAIIDQAIELFLSSGKLDFVGNDLVTTFPAGMEVEVFRVDALREADSLCKNEVIREHGTLCLRQNSGQFRLQNFEAQGFLRRPELCLEVDVEEDLIVVDKVIKHLKKIDSYSLERIIEYVDAEKIHSFNEHVHRRWKQYRSDQ